MKILRITSSGFLEGGAETGIVHMQHILEERGHEIKILSGDSRPDLPHFNNYTFKTPRGLLGRIMYTFNPYAYVALRKVLREFKPDVVHLHTLGAASPSVLFALKQYPTVATVHGPEGYTKDLLIWNLQPRDFNGENFAVKNLTLIGRFRFFYYRYINYPLYKLGFRNVDRVVAISKYIQTLLKKQGMDSAYIPNGIKMFTHVPLTENSMNHNIVFTGRLEKFKGLEHVVKALPKVVARFKDAHLYIAGTGSEEQHLRNLVHILQLEEHVTFLGHLNKREQLQQLYVDSTVVVVPSTWPEASSRSGIESMSAGRPIVASDVGAISEWMTDGKTGYLIPPADQNAIATSLIKIFSDPTTTVKMGHAARTAAKLYDINLSATSIEKVYSEVIMEHKRKIHQPVVAPGITISYVTDISLDESSAQTVHVLEVCEQLSMRGNAVKLYAPQPRTYTPSTRFSTQFLWTPNIVRSMFYQGVLLFRLGVDIWRSPPDVLYVRHSLLLFVPSVFGKLFNIPVILEVNGKLLDEANYHTKSFMNTLLLRAKVYRIIEWFNYSHATKIITVTKGISNSLMECYGIEEHKIRVIPNGVNLELFEPATCTTEARAKLGIPKEFIYVGYVGSFYKWQGLEYVAKAAVRLKGSNPEIKFMLIGTGDDEMFLTNFIKENNLWDSFTLHSPVSRADVPMYIHAFDICVCTPTMFRSGATSPFKVYEYLACGKATVVSDIEGFRNEFGDSVVYVQPESEEALANALKQLADSETERQRLGLAGRRLIETGRSWSCVAENIEELCRAVLGSSHTHTD